METCQALSHAIFQQELIPALIEALPSFEFEAKKDLVAIFNNLLRRQVNGRSPTVEYLCRNTGILDTLAEGYDDPDVALSCGAMLRECIRFDALTKIMLSSPNFFNFFRYVELNNFDVASDAFNTFKDLLTQHKPLAAEFLERNYERVFELYSALLKSTNYVTKRQSLKVCRLFKSETLFQTLMITTTVVNKSKNQSMWTKFSLLSDQPPFHLLLVFVPL